jgi:hypothetical protein
MGEWESGRVFALISGNCPTNLPPLPRVPPLPLLFSPSSFFEIATLEKYGNAPLQR